MKLETKADLQKVVDDGLEESLILEYKDSAALARTSDAISELCKDVSAMANSAGGQIVYGIKENKATRRPDKVDDGVDDKKITREWIEQILSSNVQPRMDCVHIARIDMENGKFGYVLTIDQSHTAHQAPDRKYYKRFELQSVPMYDYEIRDIMRRATTPDLHIELSFALGSPPVIFKPGEEISEPITMLVTITNRSSQPAYHTFIRIGIDTELSQIRAHDFYAMGITGDDIQQYWLGRRISSPHNSPIFKELEPDMGFRFPIEIALHSSAIRGEKLFDITTSVQTPGFTATEYWKVHQRAATLRMCPPGHPLNR